MGTVRSWWGEGGLKPWVTPWRESDPIHCLETREKREACTQRALLWLRTQISEDKIYVTEMSGRCKHVGSKRRFCYYYPENV